MKPKYRKLRHTTTRVYRRSGGQLYRATYAKQQTGKGLKVAATSNVLLHTPLLPLSRIGKLPYWDRGYFNSGVATTNSYVFTANGLYDPNITSTGHQPMGFDQMMLFYEHYTVSKSKITVNFWNISAVPVYVGVLIAPDDTAETVISKLNENGMYKKILLTPTTQDQPNGSVTLLADISKINGKKNVKSENDFRGSISANPTEQSYFHIFSYNGIYGDATDPAVHFEVMIEYDAIFTEPKKMIQS